MFALPAAASAQEAGDDSAMAAMAERMNDPEFQAEMALTMQAMGEILLDMPVGPLLEATAEAAGEEARKIDPDTTLRQMAPGAARVPEAIAEQTPRMMRAMSGMARGLERMRPALRAMARRMAEALPEPRD